MSTLKQKIKKLGRILIDICSLTWGLVTYQFNRNKPLSLRTSSNAYLSMIRLFCLTSGRSNDILSRIISLIDKPLQLPNNKGVLGDLSSQQLAEITTALEHEGYFIFSHKLPLETVKKLYAFAKQVECIPRRLDEEEPHTPPIRAYFSKENPKSAVYDIPVDAAIANADVQALLCDHSILAIAQSYLKASPKVEPVAFWWSAPFSKQPQINSAQMFHFDMDRIKWLKFFIFLTDVTLENGPHVFISQSHRTGGIVRPLLNAGYSRLSDDEVFKYYPPERVKTFTVPAGTIFVEDTRGLHKGTPVLQGERLVLELQFSNSYFGAVAPIIQKTQIKDQQLLNFARQNSKIFKFYQI